MEAAVAVVGEGKTERALPVMDVRLEGELANPDEMGRANVW